MVLMASLVFMGVMLAGLAVLEISELTHRKLKSDTNSDLLARKSGLGSR